MFLHLSLISNMQVKGNYEEQLNFFEAWLATPFLDKVCIEATEMNVEDNMHDEHINGIFRYWSFEEIILYSHLMLQHIDD